jgi:DNA-binding MarR family transcriptional regulator
MPANRLPDLNCACAGLRRAARLVTQLYSLEMGGNMEPTQFALLSALSGHPGASQAQMGSALGLDKTTMSRNLRVLQRNRWIESAESTDGRRRGFRLTRAGENILSATKPAWARAQTKLQSALKPGEWETLMKVTSRVAEAALTARMVRD